MNGSMTYSGSGVDIDKADRLVEKIKKIAKSTPRSGVMGEIGGFGGLYSLNLSNTPNPVLVSATDGVGTKLKIAFLTDRHDTIGIDLVAMCVNDILVQGAKPLFFLDYLAMGCLDNDTAEQIVQGVAKGCSEAGCALLGGETAEMPGMYSDKEYDISGFAVGLVDNDKIIDGSYIRNGHHLIGIASSGLHSNGFSLVRKIFFEKCGYTPDTEIAEFGCTLGEELLKPTRIYISSILNLLRDLPVHGIAHITGGGLEDNLIRVLPSACKARFQKGSWEVPPVFQVLQREGNVPDEEMTRTFNNGIGMVLVAPSNHVQEIMDRLSAMGEKSWLIGEVVSRTGSERQAEWA